jgi:hypothetical protein
MFVRKTGKCSILWGNKRTLLGVRIRIYTGVLALDWNFAVRGVNVDTKQLLDGIYPGLHYVICLINGIHCTENIILLQLRSSINYGGLATWRHPFQQQTLLYFLENIKSPTATAIRLGVSQKKSGGVEERDFFWHWDNLLPLFVNNFLIKRN